MGKCAVLRPGKSSARRSEDGSASSPASRERVQRIRYRARPQADADRRWLLASGHDENQEAAIYDKERTRDVERTASLLAEAEVSFERHGRANE